MFPDTHFGRSLLLLCYVSVLCVCFQALVWIVGGAVAADVWQAVLERLQRSVEGLAECVAVGEPQVGILLQTTLDCGTPLLRQLH